MAWNASGWRGLLKSVVATAAALATVILAGCTTASKSNAPSSAQAHASRPNVVVILADDLGWGSVGCYGADPNLVRTPSIDSLARDGTRFTDANTSGSVCTPTRYALLTGRYCWRTPLNRGVLNVFEPLLIEPSRVNMASMLKARGYTAAAVGKWHLGYGTTRPLDYRSDLTPGPLDIGFDYHFSVPSNHGDLTGIFVENRAISGLRSAATKPAGTNFNGKPYVGYDAPQRQDDQVMDVLTSKAVAWLDKQDSSKPFFLYFTPVAVHRPVTPSKATAGKSKAGPFGDWIAELDRSVGQILETLERKGLAQNTLVIFSSDNGGVLQIVGESAETSAYAGGLKVNGPWRAGKHSVYQGGFRVPFIARWPAKIPAGRVDDEMINLVDLTATIAAITGQPLKAGSQGAEDGYDVSPALLNERHNQPIRPDMITHSADGNFGIRQGQWKYIEGKPHPDTAPGVVKNRAAEFQPQLYNLQSDPAEATNVLKQNPQVAAKLSALLDEYRNRGHSRGN